MELKISFIHCAVEYKQPENNKKNILNLIGKAAKNEADIILTPEMSVSGYSFQSRNDIAEFVEYENSEFIDKISSIAMNSACYICIGLALRDRNSDAFTNSAMVLGPDKFIFRYDKINGEIRWSRPGKETQINSFDTPWGKIGLLICSDTYYGLQPRIAALQDVDLLLVPANWPPSGLDPVELWQARALENGFALAACNRTGKDLNMSCEHAESCLISNTGEILFRGKQTTTTIFRHKLPLIHGKLPSSNRKSRLQSRNVENYHSCYRNVNIIGDVSSFFDLPQVGKIDINCLVLKKDWTSKSLADFNTSLQMIDTSTNTHTTFCILPPSLSLGGFHNELTGFAKDNGIWLATPTNSEKPLIHVYSPDGYTKITYSPEEDRSYPLLNIGSARVVFMPYKDLLHPENGVAASKDGCDLIVACGSSFNANTRLVCGVNTIGHLAIAMCTTEGAGIWMRPEGHARWGETVQEEEGSCNFTLDTSLTRKKHFQDRINWDLLLRNTEIN